MNSRSLDRIQLGRIGKPYGLKGWVYVHYYGHEDVELIPYKELFVIRNSEDVILTILKSKIIRDRLIILFEGYEDRNSAESLRNKDIFINSKQLPTTKKGIFYFYQLISFKVINYDSRILGKVDSFIHTLANDVMIVRSSSQSIDNKERLIPFLIKENRVEVDLKTETITIDWHEDF